MRRILGLDGLRAIAVSLVVLAHLNVFGALRASGMITLGAQEIADVGVHLFFSLSGFLITKKLVNESDYAGSINLYNFFFNRSIRILPVYFMVVTLTLIAEIVGNTRTGPLAFAMAYTFLTNFIPRASYSAILGHTWSLAVEEHFYIVWPFLFLMFYARQKRRLLKITLVFSLATIAVRGMLSLTDLNQKMFIYRWTITAGGSIGFGCIVALLLSADSDNLKERSAKFMGCTFGLITALALIFHSIFYLLPGAWSTPVRALGAAVLIGWIYVNQRSTVVRFLEFPPVRYIGVISYGIYMWQGFFLGTGPTRMADQTWPPNQMTGLFLLILVAPVSFHFFERPLLQMKKSNNTSIAARDQ